MAARLAKDSPQSLMGKKPQLPVSDREFWLFFNAAGEIGYCSELLAQLIGRDAAELKGRSIKSILPELPVNGKTPGINVARMAMSYTNRAHLLRLALNGGERLPVQAAIRSVQLGTGVAYIVEFRWPDGPTTGPAPA